MSRFLFQQSFKGSVIRILTGRYSLASLSQVARRPSYKGKVCGLTSLPVHACTVPGIVIMLATVLPTASLGSDAVKECAAVLETIECHMNALQLLPVADVLLWMCRTIAFQLPA